SAGAPTQGPLDVFSGLAGVLVGQQRPEDQVVLRPAAGPWGQGVRLARRREQRREVLTRDHPAARVSRAVLNGLAERVQRGLERPFDRILRQLRGSVSLAWNAASFARASASFSFPQVPAGSPTSSAYAETTVVVPSALVVKTVVAASAMHWLP